MATSQKQLKKYIRLLFFLMPLLGTFSMLFAGFIRRRINKYLQSIDGIEAELGHVRLSFVRHRLTIKDLLINKVEPVTEERSILVAAEKVQLTFSWWALWRGEIVSSVLIESPEAYFIRVEDVLDKSEMPDKPGKTAKRKPLFNNLPITITDFEITRGTIGYTDPYAEPTVNLSVYDLEIKGQNLTNIPKRGKNPETTITMRGLTHGGLAKLSGKAWILEKQPAFDVNFELEGVGLPLLNPFFNAYANFDVKAGILGLYAEAAGRDGRFKGYVKPVISNLEVAGKEDAGEGFLHMLWETALDVAAKLLENDKEDQIATKIPFHGKFKKPDIGIWFAVVETLRNAFVSALKPSIDYEININSVKKRKPKN